MAQAAINRSVGMPVRVGPNRYKLPSGQVVNASSAGQASTLGKKQGGHTKVGAPGAPQAPVDPSTALGKTIDPRTGSVTNAPTALGAISQASTSDTNTNFNQNNPGSETTAGGATRTITRDPTTGATSITTDPGGTSSAANSAFMSAAGRVPADQNNAFTTAGNNAVQANPTQAGRAFSDAATGMLGRGAGDRTAAQDATYNYLTQHDAQNKKNEVAAAQQDLANRGIPQDPTNPNSLYSRTMASIDQKYQSMDDQAHNQAITSGNSAFSTDVGAVKDLAGTGDAANTAATGNAVSLAGAGNQTYQTAGNVASQTAGAAANVDPTKDFTQFQGAQSNQAPNLQQGFTTIVGADGKTYQVATGAAAQTGAASIAAGGNVAAAGLGAAATTGAASIYGNTAVQVAGIQNKGPIIGGQAP